jgi:hypothetical protein
LNMACGQQRWRFGAVPATKPGDFRLGRPGRYGGATLLLGWGQI